MTSDSEKMFLSLLYYQLMVTLISNIVLDIPQRDFYYIRSFYFFLCVSPLMLCRLCVVRLYYVVFIKLYNELNEHLPF